MLAFTILFSTLAYFAFTHRPAPIDSLDSEYWHGAPHAVYNTRPNGPGPIPTPTMNKIIAEQVPVQVNGKAIHTALVLRTEDK